MKKFVSLLLAAALLLTLSVSAYAYSYFGYAANDVLRGDFRETLYDEEDCIEMENALVEKLYSDLPGSNALPFWCWVDINGDGVSEIVLDNNNGTKGVETVSSKTLKGMGGKTIVTKGSFTVYYWNCETLKPDRIRISSGNMFLSLSSDGRYLVASEANGNTETYTLYGFFPQSIEMLAETYTLTYSGFELKKITVKDSFGKTKGISDDECWTASLQLLDIISTASPLTFRQTS